MRGIRHARPANRVHADARRAPRTSRRSADRTAAPVDRHELLPEGLRLRFTPSAETLASITRAVEAERHCCRFLRFTITVEPDDGPLTLDLTGPHGTREFVVALLEM